MKDLLSTGALSTAQFTELLALAKSFKANPYQHKDLLKNDTVALYFSKPSTRTRISFETAIARLGGTPLMLGANDLQLGRGETIADTARVISRYCRAFIIRTFKDSDVTEFAEYASIPVINALTDLHHPCQSLADMLTLSEKKSAPLNELKVAYIGDGNNVTHSLVEACALMGTNIAVATPKGYEPNADIMAHAKAIAEKTGSCITLTNDVQVAVKDADALYGDVWLSMGDPDAEKAARLKTFKPYEINSALMRAAKPDAIFMHCLPAHRGEEVTAEVADSEQSVIFDQAENRLHTGIAVLYFLLKTFL